MYRVIQMSAKTYAVKIDSIEDDLENIREFVNSGDVVLLCEDLEQLDGYEIDLDEIEVVE